jgi:hypothetical protein
VAHEQIPVLDHHVRTGERHGEPASVLGVVHGRLRPRRGRVRLDQVDDLCPVDVAQRPLRRVGQGEVDVRPDGVVAAHRVAPWPVPLAVGGEEGDKALDIPGIDGKGISGDDLRATLFGLHFLDRIHVPPSGIYPEEIVR